MKNYKLWADVIETNGHVTKRIGKIGWVGGNNYEMRPEGKENEWLKEWFEKTKEGNERLKYNLKKAKVPFEWLMEWARAYCGSYFSISLPQEESIFNVPGE